MTDKRLESVVYNINKEEKKNISLKKKYEETLSKYTLHKRLVFLTEENKRLLHEIYHMEEAIQTGTLIEETEKIKTVTEKNPDKMDILMDLLDKLPDITLDGELYSDGVTNNENIQV